MPRGLHRFANGPIPWVFDFALTLAPIYNQAVVLNLGDTISRIVLEPETRRVARCLFDLKQGIKKVLRWQTHARQERSLFRTWEDVLPRRRKLPQIKSAEVDRLFELDR